MWVCGSAWTSEGRMEATEAAEARSASTMRALRPRAWMEVRVEVFVESR